MRASIDVVLLKFGGRAAHKIWSIAMADQNREIEVNLDESARPQVTIDDLRAVLAKHGRVNPMVDAHLVAIITIGRIIGAEWSSAWAWEFGTRNTRVGMYFRPSADLSDNHVIFRQIRLGELLFNLQSLKGFKARRVEWRGCEPEAIVAELESAYYMLSCGHMPTFVPAGPAGQRTPDFDVWMCFGMRCLWEAKARLETLPFAETTLVNALQRARTQLPDNSNNVIFVRIPERWSLEQDFEQRIQNPVDHLFRNSARAISVLFHWELWETPQADRMKFGLGGLEFPNLRWEITTGKRRVIETYSGFPRGWVRFEQL